MLIVLELSIKRNRTEEYCQGKKSLGAGLCIHMVGLQTLKWGFDVESVFRACELFYYLKGGTVDYGVERSEKYGHSRFGHTYKQGDVSFPSAIMCLNAGLQSYAGEFCKL